jgi:hypothetical protein
MFNTTLNGGNRMGFVSLFLIGGQYTAGNPRILISTTCMAYVKFYQPFLFAAIISELEYVCSCVATYCNSNMALMSGGMQVLRSDYEICEVYAHEPFLSCRTEVKYRLIGLVGCKCVNVFFFPVWSISISEVFRWGIVQYVPEDRLSLACYIPPFPSFLISSP